jgi:CRP/FNR family transcriptional regulator, anaerobic regulatory protein
MACEPAIFGLPRRRRPGVGKATAHEQTRGWYWIKGSKRVLINAGPRRPLVLDPHGLVEPCGRCYARSRSVCDAIRQPDMRRLAESVTTGRAAPGSSFIVEGEIASAFFNITGGTAKLYKLLPDGRRQITGFVGIGHFLGLAVSDTYAFSAEAIEPVRYCRFSRPRLRALLNDFPAMEQRLLQIASNELVAAQEQMLLLGRKNARERVASFLLAQSRLGVPCQTPWTRFALPMTRGDIADYLGLTIETVSRTLTKLRSDGLLDIPNVTEIVIRDRSRLQRIAEGMA